MTSQKKKYACCPHCESVTHIDEKTGAYTYGCLNLKCKCHQRCDDCQFEGGDHQSDCKHYVPTKWDFSLNKPVSLKQEAILDEATASAELAQEKKCQYKTPHTFCSEGAPCFPDVIGHIGKQVSKRNRSTSNSNEISSKLADEPIEDGWKEAFRKEFPKVELVWGATTRPANEKLEAFIAKHISLARKKGYEEGKMFNFS